MFSTSFFAYFVSRFCSSALDGISFDLFVFLQEGKTYRTLQKLTNVQVTKVASGLKDTRPDFNTKENRKIVYINPATGAKIDYKVVFPEDVQHNRYANIQLSSILFFT